MKSLDMSEILLEAYDLADLISESKEVSRYLELKRQVDQDEEAQRFIRDFQKVKEDYAEAKRFGIFHPNYHEAKEKAEDYQVRLREHPLIGSYLQAEEKLDQLLNQISRLIAHTVSESIKVPSNERTKQKKGC